MRTDKITVAFDVPPAKPVGLANRTTNLRSYNPSFYHAYTIPAGTEECDLPPSCEAEVIQFEQDAAANAF